MHNNTPIPKVPGIIYGGDYNPEQWPESVWLEDVQLMREAGVNLVSIAIFSWSKLQPAEDHYCFEWLDRLMDLLHENEIYANLATATASPPPWMSRYPDLAAVDEDGRSYCHGSRQHYSPSSPTYRRFAAALVRRLAERYRAHPALAAWHINNEYGCHISACHSEVSARAFRVWLKQRYKTLDSLNAAWNTAFWSQIYYSWEDIQTPRKVPTFANPTQLLDFRRFSSDALLDLYRMEKEILREYTPQLPVTTNLMGKFKPLDYWAWAKELDFVSWDSYPDFLPGANPCHNAAEGHDLTRSLGGGRPYVLMEHVTSHVHWRSINPGKLPGMIRLYGLQAIARGGDGAMYFQWRQSLAGAEQFHGSVLQHGVPAGEGRVFREVAGLGADLKKLKAVTGTEIRSRVGIVMDWNSWWALEDPGKPAPFDYAESLAAVHRYFYERNIAVDFVEPGADFGKYDLLIAPQLYLLDLTDAQGLASYVEAGGRLLTTCFSGIVDSQAHVVPGGYPAALRQVLGLWVEEWFPLAESECRDLKWLDGSGVIEGRDWSEVIHLDSAGALADFTDGHLAGMPAVTRNNFGKGQAFYIGTVLRDQSLARVLDQVCSGLNLSPIVSAPDGVEVSLRESADHSFLFLLNHNQEPVEVVLGEVSGQDLLSGKSLQDRCLLPAFGVIVLGF